MSMLKLKLLVTTSILLLVALQWIPGCLGDEEAGDVLMPTPNPDQQEGTTDLPKSNSELSTDGEATTCELEKRVEKRKEKSGDVDGYINGNKSDDGDGSEEMTREQNELDDGYLAEKTTEKPNESCDGSPDQDDRPRYNEGIGKGKTKENGKGKGKGRDKGKDGGRDKRRKTYLESVLPEDCGRAPMYNISSYIAGGFEAQAGEYPPYVRVDIIRERAVDRDFCGGTLISNRHVITAAHCLEHAKEVDVIPTILAQNENVKVYKQEKFCHSPGYNPDSGMTTHDIGLVTLTETVEFNDLIQPACLPKEPLNKRKTLRAVGLGANDKTQFDALFDIPKFPTVLQVLPVKVEECNTEDKHETTICCVPNDPKHVGDTCAGDSGGPIFGLVQGRLTIFAATSRGPAVCKKGVSGKSINADIYNLMSELEMLYKKCGQVDSKEQDEDDTSSLMY